MKMTSQRQLGRITVFIHFENEWLQNLKKELYTALSVSESLESDTEKQVFLHRMHTRVTDINKRIEQCFQDVPPGDKFHQYIKDVATSCRNNLTTIQNF